MVNVKKPVAGPVCDLPPEDESEVDDIAESSHDVECKLNGVLLVTIDTQVGRRIGETQGIKTDS